MHFFFTHPLLKKTRDLIIPFVLLLGKAVPGAGFFQSTSIRLFQRFFCEALSHSIYNLFRLTFSNVPMLISFDSGTEKYYLHMGLKQNPSKSIKKTIEKKYSIRSSMAFRSRYSKALTLKHFFHKKIRLDFKTSQIHDKRLIICSKYQ